MLKSDFVEAYNNLGLTLRELGRLDDAMASFEQRLELASVHTVTSSNLKNVIPSL